MKNITVSFLVLEDGKNQLYIQDHSIQDDLQPNQCSKAKYLFAYSDLYMKKKKKILLRNAACSPQTCLFIRNYGNW